MAAHDTLHDGQAPQWLAVQAGTGRYLVPLPQAGEIFPCTTVQATPYTRAWFLGVANLRGRLCGVVDLGQFLSQGTAPAAGAEGKLLGFNTAIGLSCVLRVDQLLGLRGLQDFAQSEPCAADAAQAPAWFGPCHTDTDGQCWQTLDLPALAQSPAFLAIDA